MKKLFYLTLFLIIGGINAQTQSFTIVSPEGLTPPYEVAPGTAVTFRYDYFFEAPTAIFTHTEYPVFPDFGTDPLWTEYNDYTDNGDGTYNVTVTINEHVWVWGGFYSFFISQWSYTEALEINIASGIVISGDDLILCDDGMDTETLTVEDTYTAYQWYFNGAAIDGATGQTYDASTPGAYYAQVDNDGEMLNSNTLNLSFLEISLTGAMNGDNSGIILTTEDGMDTYQWLSGTEPENLSPIAEATASTYTADISSTYTYYAVEVTLNGCTLSTPSRPIVDNLFIIPAVSVSADTNSYNVVCEGTDVTFSTADSYSTYRWLRNGFDAYNSTNSITVNQNYQQGSYSVEVTNNEWPEIVLTSGSLELNYLDIIKPQITGIFNFSKFCPGDELNAVLSDEGYAYSWYLHEGYNNYTEEDLLDVQGSTYSFTFDSAAYLTVVGEFNGCKSSTQIYMDSYANASIFLSIDNWDQQYLCPDSSVSVFIPAWAAGDYQNFQWFESIEGTLEAIPDATNLSYLVTEPGSYYLQATVAACPSIDILSNEKVINDYTERELNIWANDETLCAGEETTLNFSGGFGWSSIQWFEEIIQIGSTGYEESFTPIIGAGTETSLNVSEFNSYLVKAKHNSCPNGIKTTSNIINIRPRVNPSIFPDPDYGISGWHPAPYDSIAAYIFCTTEPVKLNLDSETEYQSYNWYTKFYAGDDDYELGEQITGEHQNILDIMAEGASWYTAEVDSAGCVGYSDPILIDTYVFAAPTVTSYNNSELCEEGDSTLLHISFQGEWAYIEWYNGFELIPQSNNDTLWVKEPGSYTATAYPSLCPEFGFSSGSGVNVDYLYAEIQEDEDYIFALPFYGEYQYQWYFNGEPIDGDPFPSALAKANLLPGEYTVAVTNPEPCTALSDPFIWMVDPTNDLEFETISVYPNPTSNFVFMDGFKPGAVEQIQVFDLLGKEIKTIEIKEDKIRIDLSRESYGVYFIEIKMTDGSKKTWKINRV